LVLVALAACGQNPEQTEHARGLISGTNVVLAMTIIVLLVSAGLIVGALALDRAVKARRALALAPPTPPEEEDEDSTEVVAGIGVGRAPVPRWLYGVYVVIPVFALLYVLNAVALAPKAATTAKPSAAAQPAGPVTTATVAASGIKFDVSTITVKANSPITITFENKDAGVPHNFTVWPSQAAAQSGDTGKVIKAGNTITGVATTTETFKAGPPGKLFFECTIHPTSMFGTIVVSSAPTSTGGAAVGPATKDTIAASGIKFDKSALTLKANAQVTITFENKDAGVPHNFTVWPSQAIAQAGDTSKAIKPGNTITGVATTSETFKTGPPGKLFFECTIHPTSMSGVITLA